jgi:carbonic anhydrase/acetyltransferase-like protein (isoleucine patch superfamily)
VVEPIVVSDDANVPDGVVIHVLGGKAVTIGPASSIAHAAVIHGPCEIGANCFVGFNTVVFKAVLGDGVVVMHHAVVESVTIPSGLLVPSMTVVRCEQDVQRLARTPPDVVAFARKVSQTNTSLAEAVLNRRTSK